MQFISFLKIKFFYSYMLIVFMVGINVISARQPDTVNWRNEPKQYNITDFTIQQNRLAFTMKYFTPLFVLCGISFVLARCINKYSLPVMQKFIENSAFLKNHQSYSYYLKYVPYIAFWPALKDFTNKLRGVPDLYQSPNKISQNIQNVKDYNIDVKMVKNETLVKKQNLLMLDGANKFDNILWNVVALYSFNFVRNIKKVKNNDISFEYLYLYWGNYICPAMRKQSILIAVTTELKDFLDMNNNEVKEDIEYLLEGQSYGGIVAINILYKFFKKYKDSKYLNKNITIITHSSPYTYKDIKRLKSLLETMPNLKVVGLLKYLDSTANYDPFPQVPVNSYLIKKLYDDACAENKKENKESEDNKQNKKKSIAERIFIAMLWNKKTSNDGGKGLLIPVCHNEPVVISGVLAYAEKQFSKGKIIPPQHFIVNDIK